jgi:hypothetical protein
MPRVVCLRFRFAGVLAVLAAITLNDGTPTTLAAETKPDALVEGWEAPPLDARLRAYWWWLNGNVTQAAITRDLEEMKAKGFGGALICDAGGAEQDGNARVPHGPTFFTPEWRELYRHTLREAHRLGLEMSLNIMSGWNLGGPPVTADDAAKKLTWSEARVTGPGRISLALPVPKHRDGYYRDQFVVAYRLRASPGTDDAFEELTAASAQGGHAAALAGDGDPATFWVSSSDQPGQGPTRQQPQWLQLAFRRPVTVERLSLMGRASYGPRDCELEVSDDGKAFRPVKAFTAPSSGEIAVNLEAVSGRFFRVVFFSSYDPRYPDAPRNVQVAELRLEAKDRAWPSGAGAAARKPIQNWAEKAIFRPLQPFSAPDSTPLFQDHPATPGEEDTTTDAVVDLTRNLNSEGTLNWEAPEGEWQVLRFGYTIGDHSYVSTCSDGWKGYALDVLDAGAFERYWDAIVEPLISDAGPLAGKTLRYLHTDSWEVEPLNWTPRLFDEFRRRQGYDPLPFLPVLAGRIVNSREQSNRFLDDFRKTIGDLAIDNHYRIFRDRAHQRGLLFHPESGGPHGVPIDAQRCLGWNDAPMSEFWAWSWRHRVGDQNRFFVKQPAAAAHTYGRKLVLAEGFTTIGPHWQETIWDNLKPSFDKALCEGMNLLVWHAFVCSPEEMGLPGQQYFAGTHFNPNTTWWAKSGPFLSYLNRAQFLLQQGLFVADACYYYGDHVPNFAQLKRSDPARVLPGYDYDVITEEAVLTRLTVREGRWVLPDGMSYRVLVLPDRDIISLPVLRRLKELVPAGGTVLGPKPRRASGLSGYPASDAEVRRLADEIWADCDGQKVKQRTAGRGRVIWGRTAREVLLADGVGPDFEVAGGKPGAVFDYIHRAADGTDIYFVANGSNRWEEVRCSFRVAGKAPELWDAVSGERRMAAAYETRDGVTTVPLQFGPYGSWFVVFRAPAAGHAALAGVSRNHREFRERGAIRGPWVVKFDPRWGGPASATFDDLTSWTTRPEPGIKFYSGTAVYTQTFALPPGVDASATNLWLDLGELRELAEVRLNGKSLGVVWAPPFRVRISGAVQPSGNRLEVDVVNFWPNRIIGDEALPVEKRLTRTNIRKLTRSTPLMESGLIGPVTILEEN